ncbi:MAG TPA: hypothetical protein VM029_20905 [Opitutaceae bacterium]|nr:hypothetical protein [Opitutaceae bacterium]
MTASFKHQLRRAGAHYTMGCQQQRCTMRPVVLSVWNKKTGAGNQN